MSVADQINRIGNNLYGGFRALGQDDERTARIGLAEAQLGADLADRAMRRKEHEARMPVMQNDARKAKAEMDYFKGPAGVWDIIQKDSKFPGTHGLEHLASSKHLLDDIQNLIGADLDQDKNSQTFKRLVKRDGSGIMSRQDLRPFLPGIRRLTYLDVGLGRTFRARDEKLEVDALAPGRKGDEARTLLPEFRKVTNDPAWKLARYQAYRDSLANEPYQDEALKRAIERADKHIERFQKQVDKASDQKFRRQLAQEERGYKDRTRSEDQKIRAKERAEDQAIRAQEREEDSTENMGGHLEFKNGAMLSKWSDVRTWWKTVAEVMRDDDGKVIIDPVTYEPMYEPMTDEALARHGVRFVRAGDKSPAPSPSPTPKPTNSVRMPVSDQTRGDAPQARGVRRQVRNKKTGEVRVGIFDQNGNLIGME